MKALVLSDSHGDLDALTPIIQANIHSVQHVVHLGDGCGDMDFFLREYPNTQFHIVSGNCDCKPAFPEKLIFDIGGNKILAAHGHRYGVKTSPDRIRFAALEAGVNICLFGLTHHSVSFEFENIYFMNPGAVCSYMFGCSRYGIIDFSEDPPIFQHVLHR